MWAAILPTTWGSCLTLGAPDGRPSVSLGGGAWCEVAGNERVQAVGRVVGHLGEPDAAVPRRRPRSRRRRRPAFCLDGCARRPSVDRTCCGRRSRFRRPRPGQQARSGRAPPCCGAAWHRAATRSCRAEVELALQLQSRDAPGLRRGGCWNEWPSDRPPRTRWSAAAWSGDEGPGGDRGLLAAASTFPEPAPAQAGSTPWFAIPRLYWCPSGQRSPRASAPRTGIYAGSLIREALLELDQGTGKIGHLGRRRSLCSLLVLTQIDPSVTTFCSPGCRGISRFWCYPGKTESSSTL